MTDISLTPAEKQALYTAQVRVSPVTPRIEAAVVAIIAARLEAERQHRMSEVTAPSGELLAWRCFECGGQVQSA